MDVTQLPIDPATDHALVTAPAIAPIQALQAAMTEGLAASAIEAAPAGAITVAHHFTAGLYARELSLAAGVCVVGKLHRTRHLFVLTQGEVLIDDGTGLQRLIAPATVETLPGIKRAIFAVTDATMMTFHVTEETDLAKIEAAVIVPESDEVIA